MKGIDIIRDFEYQLWDCKDASCISEYCVEDVEVYSPMMYSATEGVHILEESASNLFYAFPDIQFKWDDHVTSNNRVVSSWRATATHLGTISDIRPTGYPIIFSGLTLYVVIAGKIRHHQMQTDLNSALQQLVIYT